MDNVSQVSWYYDPSNSTVVAVGDSGVLISFAVPDAANAVGLTADDLVAEAEGWAAAMEVGS